MHVLMFLLEMATTQQQHTQHQEQEVSHGNSCLGATEVLLQPRNQGTGRFQIPPCPHATSVPWLSIPKADPEHWVTVKLYWWAWRRKAWGEKTDRKDVAICKAKIFSTCGFQPCSHCKSLKICLCVSWLAVNLFFFNLLLQTPSNFLWIPHKSMDHGLDITVQHPSSALDMAALYRLRSGENELHTLLLKQWTLVTVLSGWNSLEHLLWSSKYFN